MKTIIKLAASGLYLGYSPVASGTVGSLLGVLIYLQLREFPVIFIFAVVHLFMLGFFVCGKAEEAFGKKDSSKIVIDEIASMCLVYLFIKPTWFMVAAGFLLFRLFDIVKPWPGRRVENLPGSVGVMLDDIVAAVYTIVALFIIWYFFPQLSQGEFF